MLCGSNGAEVKKLGLQRLSTFGLLKHLKQDDVLLVIDSLMAMRCLQQVDVDRFRPVVELTEFGGEVMRGRARLLGELSISGRIAKSCEPIGGGRPAQGDGGGFGGRPPASQTSSPETSSVPLAFARSRNPRCAQAMACRDRRRGGRAAISSPQQRRADRVGKLPSRESRRVVGRQRHRAGKGRALRPYAAGDCPRGAGRRGRRGEGETRRWGDGEKERHCLPSPHLPVSPSLPSCPLDASSVGRRLHGGRVHGDSRADARGGLGTCPANRAGFGRSGIVRGDSVADSGQFMRVG